LVTAGSVALAATSKVPVDAASIQQAINMAKACDTVLEGDGTYVESTSLLGKGITVTSVNEPTLND